MTSDCDLLRCYAEQGEEEAFAEVVRRQTNLVYGAALRVTNDRPLAEEVTQKVFTLLAQQAAILCRHDALAGWLYTTTRHRALDAVRSENRRRGREQEASLMQNLSTMPEENWEQLRPHLDEAMDQLRERDRQAILLRFFNGLSYQELGAALGLSENTAQKCLGRALDKLRAHFQRRGVTTTVALLATALTANGAQTAPTELAGKVTTASLAGASGGGILAGSTLLMALFMSTKTKLILVGLLILATAAWLVIRWQSSGEDPTMRGLASSSTNSTTAIVMSTLSKTSAGTTQSAAAGLRADPAPKYPIVTVAKQASAGTSGAATAEAAAFEASPKADLPTAIETGIHFLESQDPRSFFKTLMPPSPQGNASDQELDAFVEKVSQDPNGPKKFDAMLQALTAIQVQNLNPRMNDDQTRAIYTFETPVSGKKVVIFNKVDGFWYLDGM